MKVMYKIYTNGEREDAELFMDFAKMFMAAKISDMMSYPVCDVARCEIIMPPGEPKVAMYITCRKNIYRAILNDAVYFEFIGTRNALTEGVFSGIVEHVDRDWAVFRVEGKEYSAKLIEYETSTPPEWNLWPTDKIEFRDGKYYVVRGDKILFEIEKRDMYAERRCPFIEDCQNATVYCRTDFTKCPDYQAEQKRKQEEQSSE